MKKKILSIFVTCIMIFSMLPLSVFADIQENEQGHNHNDVYCSVCKEGILPEEVEVDSSDVEAYLLDSSTYFTSLSQAIENAYDGSTIEVVADTQLNAKVTITNKKITISGLSTITRDVNDVMIEVGENAEVTLKDIKFNGNNQYYYDYSIVNVIDGGKVTVDGATFEQNTANYGGAFYVAEDSSLVILNGNITACEAKTSGGAIYNEGTTEIYDGSFQYNNAQFGGVIENIGTSYIQGGVFENNMAIIDGATVNAHGFIYVAAEPSIYSNTNTVNGVRNNIKLDNDAQFILNGVLGNYVGISAENLEIGNTFGTSIDGADGAFKIFNDLDETVYGDVQDGMLVWTSATANEEVAEADVTDVQDVADVQSIANVQEMMNVQEFTEIEAPVEEVVEPTIYTVSFDVNGPGSSPDAQEIAAYDYAQQPVPTSTRDGLEFVGWFLDTNGTVPFDFNEPIVENVQLYGYWKEAEESVFTVDEISEENDSMDLTNPETIIQAQQSLIDLGYLNDVADGSFGPKSKAAMQQFQVAQGLPVTEVLDDNTLAALIATIIGESAEPVDPAESSEPVAPVESDEDTVTVSYDLNGYGTVAPDSETVNKNGFATKPADVSDENATFIGWYDNAEGNGEVFDFETTPITSDITLYAVWEEVASVYTVSYVANGFESVPSPESVIAGAFATRPEDPAGKPFAGWYDNENFDGEVFDFESTPINSDVVLYAKASAAYTVAFEINGHGTLVNSQTVYEGDTPVEPVALTEDGWVFTGWYYDSSASVTFDFTAPITADTVVYAGWVQKTSAHTVVFEANGYGTAPASQVVEDGAFVTTPVDPTASGMAFKGWFTDKDCTRVFDFSTPITEDTLLYAKWEKAAPEVVIISYNMNNHGVPVSSQTIIKGEIASRPSDPVAAGFVFGGWYKEVELTTEFDFSQPVLENTQVFAKWTEVEIPDKATCTIKFDILGHGQNVSSQTVAMNGKAVQPATPSAEGYVFGGWFTDQACTQVYNFDTEVSSDIILYAKWTPITYQIVLNSNGGTGNMEAISMSYGVKGTLPANTYMRTGYTFTGWNTSPVGDGSIYAEGAEIYNLTSTNNGIVTLYAQWKSVYEVAEGNNSLYTIGSLSPLVFRVNGDFTKFIGVKVDDVVIDKANYDSWSGNGTYVSLKVAYLDTLATGNHKIKFMFSDSEVEADFIVSTVSNVKTGDTTNVTLWLILGGAALLAGAGACVYLFKKQKKH